jgi:hypothetical protein
MAKQFRRGWAVSAWFRDALGAWRPVVHYFKEQPTKPRWISPCGARAIPQDAEVHSLTEIAQLRRNGQPIRAQICSKCRKKANVEAWPGTKARRAHRDQGVAQLNESKRQSTASAKSADFRNYPANHHITPCLFSSSLIHPCR